MRWRQLNSPPGPARYLSRTRQGFTYFEKLTTEVKVKGPGCDRYSFPHSPRASEYGPPVLTEWRTCLLTDRIVWLYAIRMIKSFRHKGLKQVAETGSKVGIQPKHALRLKRLLTALDVAIRPADMNAPSYDLHLLKGNLAGHWSVSVSGNWRLTFSFEGEDAVLVDYQDYH